MTTIDAIVLAGGRASRMGGPDKVMLELTGRSLLERTIDAVAEARCVNIAVVGPERELDLPIGVEVTVVREDPPFSGPVAALTAAQNCGSADWVLLLASDIPRIAEVVSLLVTEIKANPDADAHLIEAPDGHLEWLCSAMSRSVFVRELGRVPELSVGVRRLFQDLEFVRHVDASGISADVDTPESWQQAQQQEI